MGKVFCRAQGGNNSEEVAKADVLPTGLTSSSQSLRTASWVRLAKARKLRIPRRRQRRNWVIIHSCELKVVKQKDFAGD